MAVIIKEIAPGLLDVNGKSVQKRISGEWIAPHDELTPAELKALYNYLKSTKQLENGT